MVDYKNGVGLLYIHNTITWSLKMDNEHDLMMEHLDGWEEEENHECPGCAAGCDSCLGISWRDFV